MTAQPTHHKDDLPKGWSYPVGAELLSSALTGVPGALDQPFWFSARSDFRTKRFQATRAANEPYEILQASYGRGQIFGDRRIPLWEVHVYAVPSRIRSVARTALMLRGLIELRDWLLMPRTDVALDGGAMFAVLMRELDPSFISRARGSRFEDTHDTEWSLERNETGEWGVRQNKELKLTKRG
jgi:hypothetical protein